VSFIGMLQGEIKWGAYDAAEIFVLPSHQENFGIAVAEALASRVPVLTTNKVNIWREIEGAGAGFIDIDTQAGIDRLLRRWLEMPEPERLRMRERAIACFLDLFEIGRVADKLQQALDQAASTERTPFSYANSRPRWLAGPAARPPGCESNS
jgi:glycosyltransferase involved in cell wall biosynthesis